MHWVHLKELHLANRENIKQRTRELVMSPEDYFFKAGFSEFALQKLINELRAIEGGITLQLSPTQLQAILGVFQQVIMQNGRLRAEAGRIAAELEKSLEIMQNTPPDVPEQPDSKPSPKG